MEKIQSRIRLRDNCFVDLRARCAILVPRQEIFHFTRSFSPVVAVKEICWKS